jgi:aspartate/methionine/tyrosine aminotransferase
MIKQNHFFSSFVHEENLLDMDGLIAKRTQDVLKSSHCVGNFFHYRHALEILGIRCESVFHDGCLYLDPHRWADFGPLNFHLGPSRQVIKKIKNDLSVEALTYYSPDLLTPLRDLSAQRLFQRCRDSEFDVIGTEGAHASLAYTIIALVEPGDEVIITDPGYFFSELPVLMAGGVVKRIVLNRTNGYRLKKEDITANLSKKTKMIIVCDPINPFGTVQTKNELIQIVKEANRKNIIILNNITHGFHQINKKKKHQPIHSLKGVNLKNVVSVAGISHAYGLAGLRLGFVGGSPELLHTILIAKSALTRINVNIISQYAALAAFRDQKYCQKSDKVLQRNFLYLRKIIQQNQRLCFVTEPDYGYFAVVDISQIQASSQELTIALLKRKCAVYASDGLGDEKATSYIRINFSTPYIKHFKWLEKALPEAIKEAESGIYRKAVLDFFQAVGTARGKQNVKNIKRIPSLG